jgi:hypothetical protein
LAVDAGSLGATSDPGQIEEGVSMVPIGRVLESQQDVKPIFQTVRPAFFLSVKSGKI